MPDENIQAMIDNAFSDNPTEMRAAFYDAINDRVYDALQQRKQEMAKNFITQYNTSDEDTDESENEDNTEESETEDTDEQEQ